MIDRDEPSPHIYPAAPAAPVVPASERQSRPLANVLRIWLLCDRVRCRRAWRCRGRALDCVPRLTPRVPMSVRRSFAEYRRGRALGLSPELASFTRVEDEEEVQAWYAARPARRRRSQGGKRLREQQTQSSS